MSSNDYQAIPLHMFTQGMIPRLNLAYRNMLRDLAPVLGAKQVPEASFWQTDDNRVVKLFSYLGQTGDRLKAEAQIYHLQGEVVCMPVPQSISKTARIRGSGGTVFIYIPGDSRDSMFGGSVTIERRSFKA
jgi:hypothetical protein